MRQYILLNNEDVKKLLNGEEVRISLDMTKITQCFEGCLPVSILKEDSFKSKLIIWEDRDNTYKEEN